MNIQYQGKFTSDGSAKTIAFPGGVDWIQAINLTQLEQSTANSAYEFYWQLGMGDGLGIFQEKLGAVANDPLTGGEVAANTGFFYVDSSLNPNGPKIAVTASTVAADPVFSTGNTASLSAGDIVRLVSTATGNTLNGVDFSIEAIVASTSFRMAAPLATAQTDVGAGFYRKINYQPLFYPRFRYIASISQAVQAVVVTTVPHGYQVGQIVSFHIPSSAFGMVELNGLSGTIVSVSDALGTQSFTVDIDTTSFSAYTFPTNAVYLLAGEGLGKAIVVPDGLDLAEALAAVPGVNQLGTAYRNTGFIGMTLVGGAGNPGGAASDVIFWRAGTSDVVNNE